MPPAPKVLILTAMPIEMKPILRRLNGSGDQRFRDDNRLCTEVLGVGRHLACERLEAVLREQRPDQVILAGFAGGLAPSLHTGDVAHARNLLSESGEKLELVNGRATLLTTDVAVTTIERKRQLRQRYGADLVDMESWHVAHRVAAMGVPLTVIRAVSDAADDALPADVVGLTDGNGRPRAGRIAWCLVRRPWRVATLLRLARAARVAGAALADAVLAEVATLRR